MQTITIQYCKLYDEIRKSSDKLRKKKVQVGMNLNVGSFSKYMENAFSRLAKDLTSLIDFHYMASKDTDRPSKFHEHITNLLVKLKVQEEKGEIKYGDLANVPEAALMDCITPFITCCIAQTPSSCGGVRGILKLMILRKVTNEVGFGIPIQELFDLAIGTSTVLGLFKMDWSVDKAISEFETLSHEAFSKHQ
ncbi:hypothetical protein GP486_005392 [Trichoglossum hirsutum]|uniref:Uncharacterized protein n=1 Tax=Trichoglossum hirsutum TaxID=265104 RepID=A0A9P8L991_9PEZI|nr:hypothetical protein GP486_005392 [Trichoglossum hirsutum]